MTIGPSRYDLPIGSPLAPPRDVGGPPPTEAVWTNNGTERSSPLLNEQIRRCLEQAAIDRYRKLFYGG